jgi:hypothetical protein
MATVREHLKKAHEAMAEHHRIMAKCHGEAMGKADDPHHGFHKSAKNEHEAAAQVHDDLCNECAKAADGDLNKLVPHQVSAVAPDRPSITPVLRNGMRPLPAAAQPDLSKLLGLDPEDLHVEEKSLQ